jgi:hypothetical protein
VAHPETARPAIALHDEPASNVEWLGRPLNPPNTPSPDQLQAPDDAGESDLAFFTKHPNVNARTRLPFPNEFPPGLIDAERIAFVHVFLASRDPKTNAPGTRARGIFYADNKGGRA